MFPFERFMGVLKKYVHNRASPEGSIAKGHENEEVIEFCIDFIPDLKPIGVPESRHKGRLDGKGTLGGEQIICMDGHSLTEAHCSSTDLAWCCICIASLPFWTNHHVH